MSLAQAEHPLTDNLPELQIIQDYSAHRNTFFGFREEPFRNTPDPDFFFMSRAHREVLVSLLFAIQERRGFCAIAGEIGSGKTTLVRQLLRLLPPTVKTAVILNPKVSASSLLAEIVRDFGIQGASRTKAECFDKLNRFLLNGLSEGQNAVILIDEAQWLSARVLDELRMLSNLETVKQKLLQIVLVGQPELKDILEDRSLRQLRQRLAFFLELKGLGAEEMRAYVHHRLAKASLDVTKVSLEDDVLTDLFNATRGIPRLINSLCDRLLMAAFFAGETRIHSQTARRALEEMQFITREELS
ncbi:MAG: AAA family ATPase [Candidatus Omnitrophica bacterium]|nr:AAA family ATPase [Candidatus Omnitrophota bacterium]